MFRRVSKKWTAIGGSLSPRHGASSGCGWRNGLQIRRVAANILNKQSKTADKGWSTSFRFGRGVKNYSPLQLKTCYKSYTETLELDRDRWRAVVHAVMNLRVP